MDDGSSRRIADDLRARVAAAAPGERLPSTRALVAAHGASPVTVQRAVQALVAQGLVETRPGTGTFVRAPRTVRAIDYGWQTAALRSPQAPPRPVPAALRSAPEDVVALHNGYPDRDLLPERLVRQALVRTSRGAAATARPPVEGLPELRRWFADGLAAHAPAEVAPVAAGDVVVLPGSQSGLASVFRALVPRGRPLLMESPTYWGAVLAAAQAGATVVPVPSGPHGPDPDEVDRAFAETGARLLYAQPSYANPTGAQWSAATGARVLEVVRRHGAFLVEDDWAHDLGIDTAPSPLAAQDDGGHVVYLRSLTKSVSPAVRVAAVVARGPARDRVLADRGAETTSVSGVLQAAALDVVTQPAWAAHLRGLRRSLRARRDLLLTSLRTHAPQAHVAHVPAGGLSLWARLPDGKDVDRVVRACEADRVLVAPGDEWFPAEPSGPFLRLSYCGADPSAYPEAARVLGRALAG
ncbi:PLP-dependent aminotransferase family protein [Aquipuribacter hungaricus]|uniref:PLP-dependent aminotransferase family protein n=1 Tax=Aquipuribacter hungaricus TaxID=545624 RepID=A0ABV7WCK2_9MICO